MIIIIIMALLVLIVIGVFFMTGGSRLFGQISTLGAGTTGGSDVTALRTSCQQACNELNLAVYSQEDVSDSRYCTISLDITDETGQAVTTYCNAVLPTCTVSTVDGEQRTIDWTGRPNCERAGTTTGGRTEGGRTR